MPVGHNTLSRTVGRLCKQAGISGCKTSHLLRVTNATRLFQSGVDEQLIVSHTGHRSVDGVRSYKRISEDQKKSVSDVLNSATSGDSQTSRSVDPTDKTESPKKMKVDVIQGTSSTSYDLPIARPRAISSPNRSTTVDLSLSKSSSRTPSLAVQM